MIRRVALVSLVACLATSGAAHERITTKVSWTRDVGPLVQARCVSCHAPGGRGPMSLLTYEEARPWARAIKEEILARRMPKWHAARGYGDFANDPSLSSFEIAMIAAWVDGGAPEDLPNSLQPERTPVPARLQIGSRSVDGAREITVPCTNRTLPDGELLAVRPRLARGGSVGISVLLPSGRREVVAWIRGFEPDFAETYWLRTPVPRRPNRRLMIEATTPCALALTMR